MTRILVIQYSQTGQLTRLVRSLLGPLVERPEVVIDWAEIHPEPAYRFPWKFLTFLDTFPESVYLDPPPVRVTNIDADADYDLVVLAYQVWFLSPSLPVTGFFRSPAARVLAGKRVITVIGCRNMWVTAHRTMLDLLRGARAELVDNVVFTDQGPLWSTFITTPWWLLTGNKGPLLGVFPEAGISHADIAGAARFGRALAAELPAIARGERRSFLYGLGAVTVNRMTLIGERIGHRSFRIWGRLIRTFGSAGAWPRKLILVIYFFFLVAAIVFVLPITLTIASIAARLSSRLEDEARALEAPSGAGVERVAQFR